MVHAWPNWLNLLFALTYPILALLLVIVGSFVDELLNPVIDYSCSGRSANPWISGVIYICFGAAIGFETASLLPHRLFPAESPFPGISLLLAPLGAGLFMHFFAPRWKRSRKSWLETFWGAVCVFHRLGP